MKTVLLTLATALAVPSVRQVPIPAPAEIENIVRGYATAAGGAPAIAAVSSRITRGTFDNGRGLTEPFVTWVKLPDRVATQIGPKDISDSAGSGRAGNGRTGWDKNFVGTGLRDLTPAELTEIRRTADPFRPAHLLTACTRVDLEERSDPSVHVVRCESSEVTERWTYNAASGLVDRLDVTTRAGRRTTIYYEDYRRADGFMVPFRERIVVPGASVTYSASSVRFNQAIPERVFERPAR
jgi:hypothetical protein